MRPPVYNMINYKRDVLDRQSLSEVKLSNLWKNA